MKNFTVVIPCYNAQDTIRSTIESVLAQTHESWEMIIVDDGSTDNTMSVIEALCLEYNLSDRIHVMGQFNRGPSHARNQAIFTAQTEYIAFLDADDLWPANRLAIFEDLLRNNKNVSIAYGKVGFFKNSPDDISTYSTVSKSHLQLCDILSENETCTMSNIVARTSIFQKIGFFNLNLTHGEDREWLLRAISQGTCIQGINDVTTYYRLSTDGLSADLESMYTGWKTSIKQLQEDGIQITTQEFDRSEAIFLRYLARRALRIGLSGKLANTYAIAGIKKSPQAYFSNTRRGVLVFASTIIAFFLPKFVRTSLFSK